MLALKQTTLKPLLESQNGIHLTAYLVNRGDMIDLKAQLSTTINEACSWLNNVMSDEERDKFLEPLDLLLHDTQIFKQMKGNIGIFRNEDSFRILNIPIDIEQSCQVATSFHVKPLLRWLQDDQEFLFLGLEKDSANLYFGSQDSFKFVDSILFSELLKTKASSKNYLKLKPTHKYNMEETETFSRVNDWILELTKKTKPKLFIAGEPVLVQALNRNLIYRNVVTTPIANSFSKNNTSEVSEKIRIILKASTKQSLERAMLEFRFAEGGHQLRKNIFQISKAVVQGKVRKLVITDEISIFGKIDHKSGGIAIHPFDQDHEDDCILDDLAQMVLGQGGEVIIAKRDEIPKGRPILAILNDDGLALEKTEAIKDIILQERFK